jgi:hypothetical protein
VTAASAQSTVTLSGALVLGVGTTDIGTAKSGMQIARQTGNLQFAGTEDLGGGLKAGFQFQTTLGSVATTNTTTSVAAQRTLLGDRAANMTVTGGFGTVLVGRTNTAVKSQMGIADVSNLPVLTGLSASSSASAANGTDGGFTIDGGDANARVIYGDTYANQIAYQSPRISGFTFSVGTVPTQAVATNIGDDAAGKDTMSFVAAYSNGPLNASVNLTDVAGGTAPYKLTTFVANYDFGIAKVGFVNQGISLATGVNPGNGMAVTVAVPMGNGNIGAGTGRRSASASTSTSFGDDVKQTFVGYKYMLSKRTTLSAVWNKIDRSGTATDVKETHILLGHSF